MITIPPTAHRPLRGCPIAVFDFETTSPDPLTCEPVQVAVVHSELGVTEPTVAYQSLIRPPCPIPAESSEVHGITDADVADAPTFAEALPDLLGVFEGRLPVAYNLAFDGRILHRLADIPFGGLCAFVVARAVDKYCRGKKLADVAGRRGLTFDAHDATADALVTAQLLPVLLSELGRGKTRQDRFGRTHHDGPWCRSEDLQSVEAFWRWTCAAGREQEADIDAYFRRTKGEGLDSMPWAELTGSAS